MVNEVVAHQVLDRAITDALLYDKFRAYDIVIPVKNLPDYLKRRPELAEETLVITVKVYLSGEELDV